MSFVQGHIEVKLPKPVLTFMGKFDNRKFPELIDPEFNENDE